MDGKAFERMINLALAPQSGGRYNTPEQIVSVAISLFIRELRQLKQKHKTESSKTESSKTKLLIDFTKYTDLLDKIRHYRDGSFWTKDHMDKVTNLVLSVEDSKTPHPPSKLDKLINESGLEDFTKEIDEFKKIFTIKIEYTGSTGVSRMESLQFRRMPIKERLKTEFVGIGCCQKITECTDYLFEPFNEDEFRELDVVDKKINFFYALDRDFTNTHTLIDYRIITRDPAVSKLNKNTNFQSLNYYQAFINVSRALFYDDITIEKANTFVQIFLFKIFQFMDHYKNKSDKCIISKTPYTFGSMCKVSFIKGTVSDNIVIMVYLIMNTIYVFFKIVFKKCPEFFNIENRDVYINYLYNVSVMLFQYILGPNYVGSKICSNITEFIDSMNELFMSTGAIYIYKITSASRHSYTCGRGIYLLDCNIESTKKTHEFIAIHRTVSEENDSIDTDDSYLTDKRICGGKKKSIKKKSSKKQIKKTNKKTNKKLINTRY